MEGKYKQWQGWGTALKPAYEPIIVARKPFKTTVVENIMKYGVGGINIDECRVEYGNETDNRIGTDAKAGGSKESLFGFFSNVKDKNIQMYKLNGRFPTNVIHDGSEEATDNMQDASRYCCTAKASKKDRDEGLDIFEEKMTTDGCIRSNKETARKFGANSALRKNIHPTVKPTELMQYLVRLVSPKGATILDPFMGSGSTGKAAMFENRERDANYKFIGIDLEKEYCWFGY